jgi:hypothetical protein
LAAINASRKMNSIQECFYKAEAYDGHQQFVTEKRQDH